MVMNNKCLDVTRFENITQTLFMIFTGFIRNNCKLFKAISPIVSGAKIHSYSEHFEHTLIDCHNSNKIRLYQKTIFKLVIIGA